MRQEENMIPRPVRVSILLMYVFVIDNLLFIIFHQENNINREYL